MRGGRTTLAVAAAMVIAAVAAPAAGAAVTVTQTDSPDPVDQGGTVTVTTTLTSDVAQHDLRAHINISRPGSQTPVDNTYLTLNADRRACQLTGASTAECGFGAGAGEHPGPRDDDRPGERVIPAAGAGLLLHRAPGLRLPDRLGQGGSTTQVNYPTEFKGSGKIKLTGVPATCTNSDFKAKAKVKAKKVSRTYAYLNGPKSEFGTPLPVSGVHGRIAKKQGSKLKVKIQAGALDPGFYELKIAAKRKGGQLKRSAIFQVCGPSFGLP